jgi:transcription elongation factor Elf1
VRDRFHDDDDDKDQKTGGVFTKLKDFDCPSCSANNPADPPVGNRDEVLCNYCGTEFLISINEEGRAKFKEL